jgi:hypothetical protein
MRTQLPIAALLSAVIVGPTAFAQTADLTEEKVRDFLDEAAQQAEEAMRADDLDSIRQWTQQHFAEDAQLAAKGSVISAGGATFTYTASLDREDVDALSQTMMGFRDFGRALTDYELEVEVQSVSILPNGEATALVRFQETAAIDPSQLAAAGASGGEEQAQEGRSASSDQTQSASGPEKVFQSTSRCDMRLANGDQDRVEIRIAACDTTTTF